MTLKMTPLLFFFLCGCHVFQPVWIDKNDNGRVDPGELFYPTKTDSSYHPRPVPVVGPGFPYI